MRLVYKETGKEVCIGDQVETRSGTATVDEFPKPHKASSEGKVYLKSADGGSFNLYVSVIGAEWIEREDRLAEA